MRNHPSPRKREQRNFEQSKLARTLRRYWLLGLCLAVSVTVLWINTPAWAAPVTRPLNQTVPDPTATPEGNPLATATPQPDDDDGDQPGGGGAAPVGPGTPTGPNITFPTAVADGTTAPSGEAPAEVPAAAGTPAAAEAVAQPLPQAELPFDIEFELTPYFVWQGITATLTITINNPNPIDAANVVLSDEIPPALTLVEATAGTNGGVETLTADSGNPLLIFRWPSIGAGSAATATIVSLVTTTLADGDVVDNLVAVRSGNVPYSATGLTIGMPPVEPPDFQ